MAIKLKLLRTSGDTVTPEDMTRMHQVIQNAFDQIPDADTSKTVNVNRDTSLASTVEFAFVDSSGGPVTISLPNVGTQTLTCRSVSNSTNAVKIQTATAVKINGNTAFITLGPLGTVSFRYNPVTKGWWTL